MHGAAPPAPLERVSRDMAGAQDPSAYLTQPSFISTSSLARIFIYVPSLDLAKPVSTLMSAIPISMPSVQRCAYAQSGQGRDLQVGCLMFLLLLSLPGKQIVGLNNFSGKVATPPNFIYQLLYEFRRAQLFPSVSTCWPSCCTSFLLSRRARAPLRGGIRSSAVLQLAQNQNAHPT